MAVPFKGMAGLWRISTLIWQSKQTSKDGRLDSDHGVPSTAAYLWNPRTGDRLPLPNIHEEHDVVLMSKCSLTHKDPSHPGCVVVLLLLLFKDQGIMPHMCFCRISGGTPWRCLPYKIPSLLGVPRFITVIAACRGKLYFISSRESMGAIHFPSNQDEDPVFQFFDAPRINFVCPHGTSLGGWTWLVESPDNNLFLIYTCYDWDSRSKSNFLVAIHAYKMDFSTHAWHRVRDIGDAVVFLDRGYSRIAASCAASPLGLKGSHIYLFDHRKSDDDASYYLCAFDLGLDTLEDIWVAPQSIIDALRGRQPFWIVPPTT
ncbi:unnamed protein product [Urochloa decumbens]|uniref:KIB1-4 beta-propeller domain-containing protein n=1 Tax=Urochloa decumbens TaxID=240449 RepID=A0ABC8WLD2_9POAL